MSHRSFRRSNAVETNIASVCLIIFGFPTVTQAQAQLPPGTQPGMPAVVQGERAEQQPSVVPAANRRTLPVNAPLDARRGPRSGKYWVQRWADDFSTEKAAAEEGIFAPLKHIAITDDAYLTFSGEERAQFALQDYSTLAGGGAGKGQGYLALRHQYGADLHLGKHVRMFGQIASAQQPGWDLTRPLPPKQQNSIDISEAFVEVRAPVADGQIGIKVGRQRLALGNGLLFALQANANFQQAHDGVVGYFNTRDADLTLFGFKPVEYRNGAFDDRSNDNLRFYGVYGSVRVLRRRNAGFVVDPFLIRSEDDAARINLVTGRDRRWTAGGRLWGTSGLVTIDWTGAYQFGRFEEKPISAGAIFTDTQIQIPGAPANLRVSLRADMSTGGARDGDKSKTFRSFYMNQFYPHVLAFLTLSNANDLGLGILAEPTEKSSIQLYHRAHWRYSTKDLVYGRSSQPLASTARSNASYMGSTLGFAGRYRISKRVNLLLDAGHCNAGDGMLRGGMRDVPYVLTELSFMF